MEEFNSFDWVKAKNPRTPRRVKKWLKKKSYDGNY